MPLDGPASRIVRGCGGGVQNPHHFFLGKSGKKFFFGKKGETIYIINDEN